MSQSNEVRWGILGAATIARKNWHAILNTGNGRVTAVASRSVDRASAFINECQSQYPFATRPAPCGSYDELLQRDDVDAVYIPLPTGLRKEWVIKAAQAGKHVVCEKPCGTSASDLTEMIQACQEHNVQFMDGVMYMHCDRLIKLREVLDAGDVVGDIRRIATHFTFKAPDEFLQNNIRVSSELEPQGCLGDLGWYTIRFALWTMKYEMPQWISGRMIHSFGRHDSPEAVPMEFSAEMQFASGVSASFYNSFRTENQQLAHISGTKGNLQLDDFVLPFHGCEVDFHSENSTFHVEGCRFTMERHRRRHAVTEYSGNHESAQETKLFRTFGAIVQSGQLDPHWPEIALKTQQVMDAALLSARNEGARIELPVN
ncbi:MAG: Gfo/Idh/MocA family oxidoreductase [Planctomycetaceae bacterium]